jgi:hypothetical protein
MKSIYEIYNIVLVESIKDDAIEIFGNSEEAKSYVDKFFNDIRNRESSSLKKDINYWVKQGFESFKTYIDNFKSNKQIKSSLNNLEQVDNGNGKRLDIIDGYEIWRVDSYKASKFLGRTYKNVSTNWCISSNDDVLFNEPYVDEDIRYYFLIKQEPIRNDEVLSKWNKVGIKVTLENTLTYWDTTNNADNNKIEKKIDQLPKNIQDIVEKYSNKISNKWWYKTITEDIHPFEKDWLLAEKYAKSHKLDREEFSYTPTKSTLNFVRTPQGIFILSVDTPEEYRGKGGASRLLQQVKDIGQNIYLDASATDDNKQEELDNLYMKHGFKRINGSKKFVYFIGGR